MSLSVTLTRVVLQSSFITTYTSPKTLQVEILNISQQNIRITGVRISVKNTWLLFFSKVFPLSEKNFILYPNTNRIALFDISEYKERFPEKRFSIEVQYNNDIITESNQLYLSGF